MAKCELHIVLERPEKTYKVGEKIKGAVEVGANDDCECRELTLTPCWRTQGKGNKDSNQDESQVLFKGAWHAGQSASYPFELDAPYGPLTYEGKLFSIHWHLRAHADLPHALDAEVEEAFLLGRGKIPPEADEEDASAGSPRSLEFQVPPNLALGVGAAITVLCLYVLWHFRDVFTRGVPRGSHVLMFMMFAAFGLLIGGSIIVHGIRHVIMARTLGPVDAQLSSDELSPGDTATLTIRFRPRGEIELTEATLNLTATEKVVKGSGKNKRTLTGIVHEEKITLASERRMMPEEGAVLEGTLHLPPTAPPTFSGSSNSLEWKVDVRLNLRRLPDWRREFWVDVS